MLAAAPATPVAVNSTANCACVALNRCVPNGVPSSQSTPARPSWPVAEVEATDPPPPVTANCTIRFGTGLPKASVSRIVGRSGSTRATTPVWPSPPDFSNATACWSTWIPTAPFAPPAAAEMMPVPWPLAVMSPVPLTSATGALLDDQVTACPAMRFPF